MDNNVLEILDVRTPAEASKNFKVAIHNEAEAMRGLVTVTSASVGLENVWSEKIEMDEKWEPGKKLHIKPDYFLYVRRKGKIKKWTIEVKTTWYDTFESDVILKAPQVWTCKNNPKDYPNPYVLMATYLSFALVPMGSFWNGRVQDIRFGDFIKKGFLLNCDDYDWHAFVNPLKFILKKNDGIISGGLTGDIKGSKVW